MYTIKELKEIIKDLPDDTIIGGTDHFGELLECNDIEYKEIDKHNVSGSQTILYINIESPGTDPDDKWQD